MDIALISHSDDETRDLGAQLAGNLHAGDVIALYGGLGSGKTCIIQGICRGLHVAQRVTSPTFTLINEYSGQIPVYHMDFYRIEKPEEAFEMGWEEYIYGSGICLIEWAERVEAILPPHHFAVDMEFVPARPGERKISVRKR